MIQTTPLPRRTGIVERYRERLHIDTSAGIISLLEGSTPLIPAHRLADRIAPGADLYLKYEGLNPTGSFKDRGMAAAMTQAAADGSRSVLCASTGNTAASAAAYAARAGLRCAVVIPRGNVALGKLAGAIAYGARVLQIDGNFDEALNRVREACEKSRITLVNSVNPARIEGQKTAAFEIIDDLGEAPDWLCLPVGNAGNITSYWRGFAEAAATGGSSRLPQLLGAQAAGSAPIVLGRPVPNPNTVATAIRIGNPARWEDAVEALSRSQGRILAVADEEILDAYRLTARSEGVFCEPASAASLAGLRRAVAEGVLEPRGKTIVCVLTGHGLKDPETAMAGQSALENVGESAEALIDAVHTDA